MKSYPIFSLDYGEDEAAAVMRALESKWLSSGPITEEFERAFAEMTGARHAVAVSNCTTALHLAMIAAGVGPGDEVLVPGYTFVASANAVRYQGATPVFVDIAGPDDLNLDPEDLERKITPRTRAIVVVHLAGYPADLDAVMDIAARHGLKVIEDACHAVGSVYQPRAASRWAGRGAGTIGDFGCFSFFANKNVVAGEGGMVVTDEGEAAEKMRMMRSHGMNRSSPRRGPEWTYDYDVEMLGFNYRCTEITAALGLVQLAKLSRNNAWRRELSLRYRANLRSIDGLSMPFSSRPDDGAHHIFPILVPEAEMRAPFRAALADLGVQTSVHYPPVHLLSSYRDVPGTGPETLPVTESVAAREVTLPLYPLLEGGDVDIICERVARAWETAAREILASV